MHDFNYIEWRYLSYGKHTSALKLVKIINRHLSRADTVFDIGCSAGGLSHYIDKYIGLELEYKILNKGRKGFSDRSHFICGDAEHLPIKTGSIKNFISVTMLEHVRDPGAVIKEIYRVSNGKGIFVLPCRDTLPFAYDPINYVLVKLNRKPRKRGAYGYGHTNILAESQWQRLITEAGFKIEEISPYDNSLFTQLEFFIFSLIDNNCAHYSDLPVKLVSRTIYRIFNYIHRIMSFFDLNTKRSFSQYFAVSK